LTYVEFLSVVACSGFLIFGSWSDLKTREVSNWVWVVSLPVAAILTITRVFLTPDLLMLCAASVLASTALSFGMFEIGFFGGADAKALITLGVALPLFPAFSRPILGLFHPFFPLVVFVNSFLLSLVSIMYVLGRNAYWRIQSRRSFFEGFEHESPLRKILTLVSGYKVALIEIRRSIHLIPIEDVAEKNGRPSRRLRVFVGAEEDRNVTIDRLSRYISTGLLPSQVWATPGLPMMVFITIAFFAALTFGDILFYAIHTMIGTIIR